MQDNAFFSVYVVLKLFEVQAELLVLADWTDTEVWNVGVEIVEYLTLVLLTIF